MTLDPCSFFGKITVWTVAPCALRKVQAAITQLIGLGHSILRYSPSIPLYVRHCHLHCFPCMQNCFTAFDVNVTILVQWLTSAGLWLGSFLSDCLIVSMNLSDQCMPSIVQSHVRVRLGSSLWLLLQLWMHKNKFTFQKVHSFGGWFTSGSMHC